jgi:hypothetical protein
MQKTSKAKHQLDAAELFAASPGLPDGIFFRPKIPVWVQFGGSCHGRCWYMYYMSIWSICGSLVNFEAIWYILWLFGIFHWHLVYFMVM